MRGEGHRDEAATAARGFKDLRTYVSFSGTEYLAGPDMTARRQEVWERDKRHCILCGRFVTFAMMHLDHHPLARSAGGDDSLGNLRTLCVNCHIGPGGKHP